MKNLGKYKCWDDYMIRKKIIKYFPDLIFIYDNYPIFVQRADLGRYVILYLYGGLYVDMDVWPTGDIISYLKKENTFIVPKAEVYTGFYPFSIKFRNWLIYCPDINNKNMKKILKNIIMRCD